MSANVLNAAAILKTKYTQPKVYWLSYKKNPGIGTVRKDETFGGDFKVIALQSETPQGGGVTIALAQTAITPSTYSRFSLYRHQDYAVARITGEAMRAAEGNDNALINLWTREMDGAIHTNKRSAAIHFFRAGTGTRGRISSGSNVNTNTITLATTSDITNFAVGLIIQLHATDGGAAISGGATATVLKMNRVTGTLTFTNALDTYIAAAAANNFITRSGDVNQVINGMGAWVPTATPTSNFLGVDRTLDPTRTAGQFLNCTNTPMAEALIEQMAMAEVEGAEVDTVWCHPRDRATVVKELNGKTFFYKEVKVPIKGSKATVGYDTIEVEFDGQRVALMSDINVPRGQNFVTQWDTWAFETLGPAPHILNYDSNEFLRVSNDDAYEVRIGYRGEVSCAAPSYTVHGFNWGQ
jgi:hypothetical protein